MQTKLPDDQLKMISGHNQLILVASTSIRCFRWLICLKNLVNSCTKTGQWCRWQWWWQFSEDGGRIIMLVSFKMYKIDHHLKLITRIPHLSSIQTVSNIRHQHRSNPVYLMSIVICIHEHVKTLNCYKNFEMSFHERIE